MMNICIEAIHIQYSPMVTISSLVTSSAVVAGSVTIGTARDAEYLYTSYIIATH